MSRLVVERWRLGAWLLRFFGFFISPGAAGTSTDHCRPVSSQPAHDVAIALSPAYPAKRLRGPSQVSNFIAPQGSQEEARKCKGRRHRPTTDSPVRDAYPPCMYRHSPCFRYDTFYVVEDYRVG
ncbi:hypothetical protein FA95DRAFT_867800 [Auriscalpium vulgare]|uniref:Uncharacterized protein n=1 Tax=Auriscalpium vulgare TaxID=40419 RepID=A0ACB8R953_9AGAM|nr:hypothetical protein FA95DRAFT_867800 [Auriscalpium vulgare]